MTDPLKDNNTEYRFVRFIRNGSSGKVAEAVDVKTNQTVAIKLIQRGKDLDIVRLRRDLLNHRRLNHHHVIGLLNVILTPTAVGIVMEHAEHGDLDAYVRRRDGIGRDLARFCFQQMAVAVEYCHLMNVVNRDIKLQNVLVTGNTSWPILKMCDFGYSKHRIADSVPDSRVGTMSTMPPEVISLENGQKYDGVKADIWCLGLFLYVLSVDQNPFYDKEESISEAELIRRIYCVQYTIPPWVARDCADLISRILVANPAERPTMGEIKQHPYFVRNLPEGAEHMNQSLCRRRQTQSLYDMERILSKASTLDVNSAD